MTPHIVAFLEILSWLLPAGIVAGFAWAARRMSRKSRVSKASVFAGRPPSRAPSLRHAIGALPTRLVHSGSDVDDFASWLIDAHPGSMAMRDPEGFAFPCYVVAIPDEGLCFDLRAIAFDPRAEMAALERKILTTAAAHGPELNAPSSARRL